MKCDRKIDSICNRKVSVIFPVYNVEKYIGKSLVSLLDQTYVNMEIICIDDGSQDSSMRIVKMYKNIDDRIRIITLESNRGLSAARNIGLNAARGEYIYFLDSDDWIEPDYIEEMVNAIEKSKCNIVENMNFVKTFDDHEEQYFSKKELIGIDSGIYMSSVEANNRNYCMSPIHIYRKEFIVKNKLSFPDGYIHEDEFFHRVSLCYTDIIYVFYGPRYHYVQRSSSIMGQCVSLAPFFLVIHKVVEYYKNIKDLDLKGRILFHPSILFKINNQNDFLCIKKLLTDIYPFMHSKNALIAEYDTEIIIDFLSSESIDEFQNKENPEKRFLRAIRKKFLQKMKNNLHSD